MSTGNSLAPIGHFRVIDGPLGDELPGKWLKVEAVTYEWCHKLYGKPDRYSYMDPITTWCDFHARRKDTTD